MRTKHITAYAFNGYEANDGLFKTSDESDLSNNNDNNNSNSIEVPAEFEIILYAGESYYYKNGSSENIEFFKDGRVQYNNMGSIIVREHRISGDKIIITDDGNAYETLQYVDLCTLKSNRGDTYALPDSKGKTLHEDKVYYRNANSLSEGILFRPGGVLMAMQGDDTQFGSYEVNGTNIRLQSDEGQTLDLEIINRRTLKTTDGTIYFCMD